MVVTRFPSFEQIDYAIERFQRALPKFVAYFGDLMIQKELAWKME